MQWIKKVAAYLLVLSLLLPYAGALRERAGMDNRRISRAAEAGENETEEEAEWNIQCLNAGKSYEESRNLKRIKVAVLDSGLDYDEDIPYVERKDFLGEEELHALYQDYTGHGTSVASLICAKKNDDRITGIAANVDLYAARILDENNEAPVSRVIQAVRWAMEKKVNIIHMSFGTKKYSHELYRVIQEAYNQNILIIASAGNDGTAQEDESTVEYPAAFSNVIAVGATNTQNKKTEISSSGTELDVVAPGDQILSAGSFGGVVVDEGTSMAAAQITGIAAVLWGKYPDKSNQFIRELILSSANKSAVTGDCGKGIADYAKSKQNYTKMSAVYHSFRKMGKSESFAVEKAGESLAENTAEVEVHDDINYVNGAWKGKKHKSMVTMTGIVKKSNIAIVKKGAVAPDYVKRTETYAKHPCFHGGGNYLANTQYLYSLTRSYLNKKGNKEPGLPSYKKVFSKANPYKGVKKKQKIRETLSEKTRNAIFTYCLGGKRKSWTNEKRAYAMLGVTLHNATDAFAHRGYRNLNIEGKKDWYRIVHSADKIKSKKKKQSAGYLWKIAAKGSTYYKELFSKVAVADEPTKIKVLSQLAGSTAKDILSTVKTEEKCYGCFEASFLRYDKLPSHENFKIENADEYWEQTGNGKRNFSISFRRIKYTVKTFKQKRVKTEVKKYEGSNDSKTPKGVMVIFSMPYYKRQSYAVWTADKKPLHFTQREIKKGKIYFTLPRKKVKKAEVKVCLANHSTTKVKSYTLKCSCKLSFRKGGDKTIKGSMKPRKISYDGNKKVLIKNKFKCKGKKFAGWTRNQKSKKIIGKDKIPFLQSGSMELYPVFKEAKKKAKKKEKKKGKGKKEKK